MKWTMVALFGSWFLLAGGVAWADDNNFFGTSRAAAVLQNPSGVTTSAQSAAMTLQPSVEEIYDFHNSRWTTGSSFALYSFSSKQIPIASLKAGYGIPVTFYGELKLDAQGVTKRYLLPIVPTQVKSILTAGVLNDAWGLVGKYGHVGAVLGWDAEHSDSKGDKQRGLVVGIALGGEVTF